MTLPPMARHADGCHDKHREQAAPRCLICTQPVRCLASHPGAAPGCGARRRIARQACALTWHANWWSEKHVKLAQKLGQLQPFIAVSPQGCTGQIGSFGPT